jgi:hypothetical protein
MLCREVPDISCNNHVEHIHMPRCNMQSFLQLQQMTCVEAQLGFQLFTHYVQKSRSDGYFFISVGKEGN